MQSDDTRYELLLEQIRALTKRIHRLEEHARLTPSPVGTKAATGPILTGAVSDPLPPQAPDAARNTGPSDELESRIGAKWLNRAGVLALLLGVSYFLKYAFDNAWVGPAGRVLMGLAGGIAIVWGSEWVRWRGYTVYSYSIKALGIGVLYLSLWASHQLYGLIPASLAFLGMVLVTTVTTGMALLQNSQVVAGLAAVGGFLTPLLLSTGENRSVSLFAYIVLLDLGVLGLLRRREWSRMIVGSFVGTAVLFGSWHTQFYEPSQVWIALSGISVFFALFLAAPLFTRNRDSIAAVCVNAANIGLYMLWVYSLLSGIGSGRWTAVVAMLVSGIYFFISRMLAKDAPGNGSEIYRAIGVSLLILAVPIGLEAQWISIGWFLEAGVLFWTTRRSDRFWMIQLCAVPLVLGVLRLVLVDTFNVSRLLLNERMLTFAIGVGVVAFVARILSERERSQGTIPVLVVMISLLVLVGSHYEIADAWRRSAVDADPALYHNLRVARDFAYSAVWIGYGAVIMFLGFWKSSRFLRWHALILIAATVCKVFLYDTMSLDKGYRILSMIVLGGVLLATSFFYQRDWLKLR